MTLRYVYQRHSGEGDPCVIPWVRTTLGREETTLRVGICCWVYVCEYDSVGRRSEEDRTRYEQNNRKEGTHTTVRRRITVAHNIRDQPYPMKASIGQRQRSGCLEERYRSLWLSAGSIRSANGLRLGVGSYCGAQLYNSSTQHYSSIAAEQVFT